jgi:phosphoribosylformylglycinamidine (FGAM) synthase-like enzyme
LGGSEYYEHLGHVGLNVPIVDPDGFPRRYRSHGRSCQKGLLASCHGIYRGGLAVHLALVAMGGELGLTVDLTQVPSEGVDRDDTLLVFGKRRPVYRYRGAGQSGRLRSGLAGHPVACVGQVTETPQLKITGLDGSCLAALSVEQMKSAWKGPFGDLI